MGAAEADMTMRVPLAFGGQPFYNPKLDIPQHRNRRMRKVLSIQSSVAHGHVGNSAAAFTLQRLGCAVVRVDTVRFSNHPAHGGFSGGPASAAEIDALVHGVAERGFLAGCDAVLSGYLGTAANGAAVARAVGSTRAVAPGALYACDPVMGDDPNGLFVAAEIPAIMRDVLVPLADIVTPNRFELATLTGLPCDSRDAVLAAARELLGRGPSLVVVTGLRFERSAVETLAITRDNVWSVRHPWVDAPAHGAGDTFAAIFLGRYLEAADPARALSLAAASVAAILQKTEGDLALVEAQEAIVAPEGMVTARALR
jgi:pyridoxine kinase